MSTLYSTEREEFIPWFANEYVQSVNKRGRFKDYLSLTPQDIMKGLEKNVIHQDEACKKVSIMMYQHLQGHRFVGLLAGPTGSGKSYIAESLKEMFPDLVYIRDVSNVTCDGWKGAKKVSSLFRGVKNPTAYNGKIYPILFLDECDKMFSPKFSSGGENVSDSVQSEFLTVIHGGQIEVKEENTDFAVGESKRVVDTSRMSFLFAGAFEKTALSIAEEEAGATIGFGATGRNFSSYDRELTMEDIKEAGCTTELCGRINKLVCLNKFEEHDFREMLDCTSRGPIYELQKEFNMLISISNQKKDEIAHDAFVSEHGIRGMKNAIREYIDELIWEDCYARTLEIE